MNLHLIGTKYRNYRNFKDTFIPLSSKYEIEIDDSKSYIDDKIKIHLNIKDVKLTKLNHCNQAISYVSIVGRNGTGKSTILSYDKFKFLSFRVLEGSEYFNEAFSYRVYIDEDTEKLYFYTDISFQVIKARTIEEFSKVYLYEYDFNTKQLLEPIEFNKDTYKVIRYKQNQFRFFNSLNFRNNDYFEDNILDVKRLIDTACLLNINNKAISIKLTTKNSVNYCGEITEKEEAIMRDLLMRRTIKFDSNAAKFLMALLITSYKNYDKIENYMAVEELTYLNFDKFISEYTDFDKYLKAFNIFFEIAELSLKSDIRKSHNYPNVFLDLSKNPEKKILKIPAFGFEILINVSEKLNDKFMEFSELATEYNKKLDTELLSYIFKFELVDCSDGEKQILELMTKLTTGMDNYIFSRVFNKSWIDGAKLNILLELDEPDEHLHPEWERKFKYLLNLLLEDFISKYEKKAKIQFQVILTTHSPFMVSDFKKNELVMLNINEGNTVAERPSKSFFGANIYDILKDTFFLDNSIGEYAKQEIEDAIEVLYTCDEIDSSQFQRIKLLSEEVSDLFIKDTLERLIINYEVRCDYKAEKNRK